MQQYNTTTIFGASPAEESTTLVEFFSQAFMMWIITAPLWFGFRREFLRYYNDWRSSDESTSSEEDEDEDEDEDDDEDEDYSMYYKTEYELLADRVLTDDDISALQGKSIAETVDFGDVVMLYNSTTECFWYYTDHLKEVSYILLEAVARKFVVEYNCKRLLGGAYSASAEPPSSGENTDTSLTSSDNTCLTNGVILEKSTENTGVVGGAAPYAKFKKYNTGKMSNPNFSTGVDVIEQTIHFRYKGKLYDYEETLKVKNNTDTIPTMTYAEFKQLVDNKKEN